jgi:hypothetical protein
VEERDGVVTRRPSVLSRQRVAPRGAGLPRRTTLSGVAVALATIAATVLYGPGARVRAELAFPLRDCAECCCATAPSAAAR